MSWVLQTLHLPPTASFAMPIPLCPSKWGWGGAELGRDSGRGKLHGSIHLIIPVSELRQKPMRPPRKRIPQQEGQIPTVRSSEWRLPGYRPVCKRQMVFMCLWFSSLPFLLLLTCFPYLCPLCDFPSPVPLPPCVCSCGDNDILQDMVTAFLIC